MLNLSDNTTHLIQLTLILAAGCVLIIFAPSIPPVAILTMLSAPVGVLIGAKVTQTAANVTPTAINQNTAATQANTAAMISAAQQSLPVAPPTPLTPTPAAG